MVITDWMPGFKDAVRARRSLLALPAAALALLICPAIGSAAVLSVNNDGDAAAILPTNDGTCEALGGGCTLRAAIEEANGTLAADQINFTGLTTPATITLGGTQLPPIISPDPLTIIGPGAGSLTVRNSDSSPPSTGRIFLVAGGATATITGMTLADGYVAGEPTDDDPGGGDAGMDMQGGGILNAGTLTLSGVTLRNNSVTGEFGDNGGDSNAGQPGGNGGAGRGGAIANASTATLVIQNSTFTENTAAGGAGGAGGDPTAPGNAGGTGGTGGMGFGGAIYNDGALTVENTAFIDNTVAGENGGKGGDGGLGDPRGIGGDGADGFGGGIHTTKGVTITGSTFSENTAEGFPGGPSGTGTGSPTPGQPGDGLGGAINIENAATTSLITNSTLSANVAESKAVGNPPGADSFGGGIRETGAAVLGLTHVTLAGNAAELGNNLNFPGTGASLRATIVADLSPGAGTNNCAGAPVQSLGFNVEDGNSCGLDPAFQNDLVNTEPLLGPLAANGGPTQTHLPTAASPVVGAVTAGCATPMDQRGLPRPAATGCDIGAVERQPGDPTGDGGPNPNPSPPDTTPPDTRLTKAPKAKLKAKKKTVNATFEFSATEVGSRFECRLDSKPFAACTSPLKQKVKKGKHTFDVVAIDAAGNRDASPASASFKVVRKKQRR